VGEGKYRDTKTNFNGIVKIVLFVSLYCYLIYNIAEFDTMGGKKNKNGEA